MYEFGEIVSVYLNGVLFLDLYFTIKNPFGSKEKRMKWYYAGTLAVFILMLSLYAIFEELAPNF